LVYQPTIKNRAIFYSDKDRQTYLEILSEKAKLFKADILAYCLMRNSVYLVVVPHRRDSLSRVVGRTSFSYRCYMNHRRKSADNIWRNRFQSCALEDKFLLPAVRFVECQPVYQKKVRQAQKYDWSSAQAHITGQDEFDVLALDVWPPKRRRKQWSKILAEPLDEDLREKLRMFTQTGRPVGSKAFVAALEKRFRKRLHPLPVGRPRKDAK